MTTDQKHASTDRELTGSEILLRCLIEENVEFIFGYPGGAVLPIYDSLYYGSIKHILYRHEQGAIHAADGYARATGKPGVVIATSGPGATNLVTGIATAQMDSIPLVCITGNVPQQLIGTDAFQEADITGITMPITKHNYLVQDVRDLPRVVKEAFHIASTGRPGPVLIDIPKDVSNAKAPFSYPETVSIRGYQPTTNPHPLQIEKLHQAIAESKRPLILAGGGVVTSGSDQELIAFAERAQIPVTTTLMGLGGFPGTHPLWLGMPGMHGTVAANRALLECDLLIGIGARFDDRVTMGRIDKFATGAKIVHIDIDPAEIGKNVDTYIPIVGDVKRVLEVALQDLPVCQSETWLEKLEQLKQQYPLTYKQSDNTLKPQWVIQHLYETTGGDAIVTTDVGQHQMWVAQYFRFSRPRSLISSGGLGTMGFGFPAAIGAQLAYPDRTVISVTGDGGFQMTAQELAVVALANIPVKVAIINNQCLGMVRQWQEVFYQRRYSEVDLSGSPDFVKLAEAYGVKGMRARTQEEARQVWREALDHPGPVVIDFQVDPEENVYPMVAPGAGLDEMMLGDE
ncbi:biosynthetic-type acetolactate synthase large subunit [Polycladomyces subterraneus]|uniref:Acetolactate synthase n=1 Tax=Polycladomyces subterraneus TaxID=1016997 RepID=A0ABT8IJH0_9BACL|nr:biosynthetic-type acetolactate synthase large subunit [Polycladomyces subterraneus]MDN4592888.1 biosynthetic-type acetolactate synthase large subunit [Polycladomyces subterraneus]